MQTGALRFCVLALLVGSCSRVEHSAPATIRHVILISIDTVRSDHLPAYGYARGSTPHIDALRREATLFQHAFAVTPLTLPSHATIFTGLLPAQHGVMDNVGYTMAANVETIASRLRQRGFSTGGAVSSYVLRRETGIDRGFDFYDDAMELAPEEAETSATRDGSRTEQALERWIASNSSDRIFAFLHLYEPHAPYAPPPEYANAATPYDGEISYADAIVGRFLSFLKQRGLYDDALIVLLSDHGEGLGDHGEEEHGIFLYREALQVPLMIKLPHGASKTSQELVSLTEVWPKIADTVSVQTPRTRRQIYAESFFGRLHFGWREQRAALDERYHYIDSARSELFDWVTDPAEKRNLIATERRAAAALRASMPPLVFKQPSAVSAEERKALESLGYLASASRGGDAAPDPKDKIATIHLYQDGLKQLRAGRYRDAVSTLRRFVSENPDMSDGWVALAQAQAKSGDGDGAMTSLRTAMSKFPENPIVVLSMAAALFERGQTADARRHAELVVDSDPVPAHELLAAMSEKEGDLAGAQRHLEEVVRRAPRNALALVRLARLHARAGRHAEAVRLFDLAVAAAPRADAESMRGVQYDRGQALLELGRVADAEAAFRAAVEAFPSDLKAWASLAVVQRARHDEQAARQTLDEAMRRNPGPRARQMAAEVLQTR